MKKRVKNVFQRIINLCSEKIVSLPIPSLLYSIAGLSIANIAFTIISNSIIDDSLLQTKIAEHVLFELEYGNERTMRHVDVTMRGFAIVPDEKYLYRSHEFLVIDQENNFKRLDSLLRLQGYNNKEGQLYLEQYKADLRRFVSYHGRMISYLKRGERARFEEEFKKDVGANFWPRFSNALSTISEFEYDITENATNRYKFFSSFIIYYQFFSFVFICFVLVLVFRRIMINRSIDKFNEKQKMIEELNKAKENMLSLMSHEIRTPLNSMIGLSHVLSKRNPRPDQMEIINTLEASGDHLIHIVNDILDYNKIHAKGINLDVSPFELSVILKQIHSMFMRMAEDRNLYFTVQIDSAIPIKLLGDPTRLVQILSNLVSNGLKFTSAGGVRVNAQLISSEGSTALVEFVVQDTGIGINESEMENIFLPFRQEKNIHGKFGGTGLGLTIVKSIVELMGGEINVSSSKSKGSTFKASIPFKLPSGNTQEPANDSESAGIANTFLLKNKKVLYVEDVESNWFLVNNILTDYSIACENAENGSKTLDYVSRTRYDLILLDVQLPDISGFDIARSIRGNLDSKNKTTPIILFSAFTTLREEELKACGANDFLGKPFRQDTLIQKMAELIRNGNK
ncbi:MAG: response regulator [Bacteroidetes bacterium]|nr:response regulator [Bacteroidota bacterium]